MKSVLKGAGFATMFLGGLMVETYDGLGLKVAAIGMAVMMAGFWMEAIKGIRLENKRRNREWRKAHI